MVRHRQFGTLSLLITTSSDVGSGRNRSTSKVIEEEWRRESEKVNVGRCFSKLTVEAGQKE
jgi:hypothetical protein